jgi:hypothetical protein
VLRVQRFRIETGYYASRYRRGWEAQAAAEKLAGTNAGRIG